ncbi:RDD family protein [Chloracidobacterium sp. D]|uniref:RDD family protein n=1 Tax=Chloracidobacterium sp. D TaxID=2821536 RepID=UPI001B8C9969|nr:RDD family protein [Chloracidobacterium sp. D]QUV82207.1 RDD family protein [Chloracidobacterium sp. D]
MNKWLVKIQGYEYETNIDELKQWIIEGRVLPEDMIFRQGLGWRIAKEVPALREAFEEQRKRPPSQKETSFPPSSSPPSLYQPVTYQNPQAEQYTLPTLAQRAFGFWLDQFSYGLFAFPGFLLFYVQASAARLEGLPLEEAITRSPYILMAIGLLINFGLNVYSTCTYGRTPGKFLMGTVVLDRESKSFLGYGRAVIRELMRMLICGSLFAGGGCLCHILQAIFCGWLVFDSERRQLYDLLLGANVYDISDQADVSYQAEGTLAGRIKTARKLWRLWRD